MKLEGRAQVLVAVVLVIGLTAAGALAARSLGVRVVTPFGASSCGGWGQTQFQFPSPLKVASPTIAWARGGFRTKDGGASWRDVSPPALRADVPSILARRTLYPPGFAEYYLDADHGWEVRTYSSTSSCFSHAAVFVTSDAGQTWQQSNPIRLDLSPGLAAVALNLDFVDPRHGWLWVVTGPAYSVPQRVDGILYGTSDGGLDWRLPSAWAPAKLGIKPVSNCDGPLGDVAFESMTTGWIPIECQSGPQLEVLTSRDGGATWNLEQLPASVTADSCPCDILRFAFFDASHALLSVFASGGLARSAACMNGVPPNGVAPLKCGGSTILLSTSDAGATWHQAPPTPNTGYKVALAFLDAKDWWDVETPPGWNVGQVANDSLYRTIDGGTTWDLVAEGLPLEWLLDDLYFVDPGHGWAFQAQRIPGPDQFGVEVFTTADGGHTWKSVIAQVDQ